MLSLAVRRSVSCAVLVALLLLPAATAAPPDGETCGSILVVEHCEGTRSSSSASCTEPPAPPGTTVVECSSTQTDETYQRVEVMGVGAEFAEVNRTEERSFEASDACNHQEGQASLVGHGYALRTTSPHGGAWVETESYAAEVHENDSSTCPGEETTGIEEESGDGQTVGIGSDIGPQPLDVDLHVAQSEAYFEQQYGDGETSWMNITGVLVGASVNGIGLTAVVGVYHQNNSAGCERYGAVILWPPLPNQGVNSGCLPT